MENQIKLEFVTAINYLGLDEDDCHVVIDEIEYGTWEEFNQAIYEFEKPHFKNVREKLGLVLELIQSSEQVQYTYPPRTKHEMNGGIKIATRRGARLHEIELFNLYFRFRSHLAGDGIALMYKSPSSQKERIILLPDNTEQRYETEKRYYLDEARDLVFKGHMKSDDQNNLIENLRMLNLHERCAQSLEHEFGHVLNVREFESLNFRPNDEAQIYKWFLESGYMFNIDKRIPLFDKDSAAVKLHILKEALVEDYRISLNMSSERGKFILPNKFCFSGDFQNPDLLEEGVDLMKRMLNNQITSQTRRPASSSDFDSIIAYKQVVARRKKQDWVAGSQSLTEDIIRRDLEELEQSAIKQAAVSRI